MDRAEAAKLETFLRKQFRNTAIRVVPHMKKKDMAEVFVGEDFVGPIYRDVDDGEVSWNFQMAILDIDLEE